MEPLVAPGGMKPFPSTSTKIGLVIERDLIPGAIGHKSFAVPVVLTTTTYHESAEGVTVKVSPTSNLFSPVVGIETVCAVWGSTVSEVKGDG